MPRGWTTAIARVEERQLQLRIEANPSDLALWIAP
jgi:hypothetical protein